MSERKAHPKSENSKKKKKKNKHGEIPHGQANLTGYSPWVSKESDMTKTGQLTLTCKDRRITKSDDLEPLPCQHKTQNTLSMSFHFNILFYSAWN